MKYDELIAYHGDRLFSGAINLDWFLNDTEKAQRVAEAYIYHSRRYHTGSVSDIKTNMSHTLTDSVTFTSEVLKAFDSNKGSRILLGIAGYGAGKSHFALTLSCLCSHSTDVRNRILDHMRSVDPDLTSQIESELDKDPRPYLVLPINGMKNSNLMQMFFDTLDRVLRRDSISREFLYRFDPRFSYVRDTVINHKDTALMSKIIREAGFSSAYQFNDAMESFDAKALQRISSLLVSNGVNLYMPAVNWNLGDFICSVSSDLCGPGKPYRGMLIVFDEFGKYLSFSAQNENVAGMGIMQQLQEGIVSSASNVILLGLSQLDLKQYEAGCYLNENEKNNFERYVSRYESAKRYYLSACFETLVANLIEVKDETLLPSVKDKSYSNYKNMFSTIKNHFQSAVSFPVWNEYDVFFKTVCTGCWPLSPALVWTLSYITSVNNMLQQRSGLNLINSVFALNSNNDISMEDSIGIPAVDLYDAGLGIELINAESGSERREESIAIECQNALEKFGLRLTLVEVNILKAIVLCNKLNAYCTDESDWYELIARFAGLELNDVLSGIQNLVENYNLITFNEASKKFEIHSDSVSIADVSKVIKQKIGFFKLHNSDEVRYEQVTNLLTLNDAYKDNIANIFDDVKTDYALEHNISTLEWRYEGIIVCGYDYLMSLKSQLNSNLLKQRVSPFGYRGILFHIVLPRRINLDDARKNVLDAFYQCNNQMGYEYPLMALIYHDVNDILVDSAVELYVLDNLSRDEKDRYSSLIPKLKTKASSKFFKELEVLKDDKNYVYPHDYTGRLPKVGNKLFHLIYPKAVSFVCDGFNTAKGNGPKTLYEFMRIFSRQCDWVSDFLSLASQHMNRATTLLKNSDWGVFDKSSGKIKQYPDNSVLKELFENFNSKFISSEGLNVYSMVETMVMPPYGFNSTEASLIAMIFISSRLSQLDAFDGSNPVSISGLTSDSSAKHFETKTRALTKSGWGNIRIVRVQRDDTKWIDLIDRWKKERNLVQLKEYETEAARLAEMHIQIPFDLMDAYVDCKDKYKTYYTEYSEWVMRRDENKAQLERAFKENSIKHICRNYLECESLYDNMQLKPYNLNADDYDYFDNIKKAVSEKLENSNEDWFNQNPIPAKLSAPQDAWDSLSRNYSIYEKILTKFGYEDEADEVLVKRNDALDKRKAFVTFCNVYNPVYNTVSEFEDQFRVKTNTEARVYRLLDDISTQRLKIKAFDPNVLLMIPQYSFSKLIDRLDALESQCKVIIQSKEESLTELFGLPASSLDNLEIIENKASELVDYFKEAKPGSNNSNLDDVKIAIKETRLIRKAYTQINNVNMTYEKLRLLVDQAKDEVDQALDGNGIYPDDEIIESFYAAVVDKKDATSHQYLNSLQSEYKNISSARDAERLLVKLESLPDFISDNDYMIARELMGPLNEYLSRKRVEYIYEQYSELSESEKQKFLELLK